MSQPVLFQVSGHVARITLNRPESGNAISEDVAGELIALSQGINRSDDVYAVILTAAGSQAFCEGSEEGYRDGLALIKAVVGIECPTIAAINGRTYGAGLELALGCDIRLVAEGATFSLPQVASGMVPHHGGTQLLSRIVGRGKALEMLLTARAIDAEEAFRIGLVSRVLPADKLLPQAEEMATKMAGSGPIALRLAKEAIHKGLDLTLDQGMRLEADIYFLLQTTADRTEGIKAFLEKRPPHFKGE
jgi:enoyl-CoA hydratase/carnithine racemase